MKDIVCMSGVELLMEYLEGALAPDVRAAIEAHVAGCQRCDAFIASYLETPRIVRYNSDGDACRPGGVAAGGVAPRHAPSRWIESRTSTRSLERADARSC